MKKVVLHIGRHKSGTTALQDFLAGNTRWLEKNGFEYLNILRRDTAHHELSEPFSRHKLTEVAPAILQKMINKVREQILLTSQNNLTLIISSEAFQNCDPNVIRQIFPEDKFDVQIVCYFRDQVSYLTSSFAQVVHAELKVIDLEKYIKVFNANYWSFLSQWNENFSNMIIRPFSSKDLLNGDIVDDFCQEVLHLKPEDEKRYSSNPSINRRYIAFKLMYNQKYQAGELDKIFDPGKLYTLLGIFSEKDELGKLKLTNTQAKFVVDKYAESNKMFYDKFIPNYNFQYQQGNDEENLYKMNEDEFWRLYNIIDKHDWPIV